MNDFENQIRNLFNNIEIKKKDFIFLVSDITKLMFPDLPTVAVPEAKEIDPDEPDVVSPVLRINAPLIPALPAPTVFIRIEPLLVEDPVPVDTEIDPPVKLFVVPP